MRSFVAAVIVSAALGSGGCLFKKNKRPLPVVAAPVSQQAQPAPAPPPEPEAAPKPEPTPPPVTETQPAEQPVAQPAPKKRTTKPVQPIPAAVPAGPEAPPPQPQPVPQLGVLMTPEQRQRYEADYVAGLASAQHGLVLAAEYKLTSAQNETVNRIKSFVKLAENVHERDPATASQLARRAALLAEDLLKTLQ